MPATSKFSPTITLTGDRTTGPLHLGHYVGSLRNHLELPTTHEQYVLLADAQAPTENADDPRKIRRNVFEVALDYLAVFYNLRSVSATGARRTYQSFI